MSRPASRGTTTASGCTSATASGKERWMAAARSVPVKALVMAAYRSAGFPATGLSLSLDPLLEPYQAREERFGPRGTAGDIDVNGNDEVHPRHHAVGIDKGASAHGRCPHSHHPLGLSHLIVEPAHYGGHLPGNPSGYDHHVRLSRRRPKDLHAEPGDVEPGGAGGDHLDSAAGEAKGYGPQRRLARPREHRVQRGHGHVAGQLFFHIDAGCQVRKRLLGAAHQVHDIAAFGAVVLSGIVQTRVCGPRVFDFALFHHRLQYTPATPTPARA